MEQRCQEAFLDRTCEAWISLSFLQEKSCASLIVQGNGGYKPDFNERGFMHVHCLELMEQARGICM